MKIMHISDLHLGINVNGVNMIEDQSYILKKVDNLITEHKIDVLIIAGDIYDKSNPSQEAIALFDKFICSIADKKIHTLIISGNHDSSVRLAYFSSFLKKENIYIAHELKSDVMKVVINDEYGPVNFYLLPFFKISAFKNLIYEKVDSYDQAIDYLFKDKLSLNQRNILVAHQYIIGAITCDSEEIMIGGLDGIGYTNLKNFDYVALGHLHRPQSVGEKHIRYCGTLLKYSFSEVNHQKSVTLLELKDKNQSKIDLIKVNPIRDMREVKGSFDELYSLPYSEDYVKVILTDEIVKVDARIDLLSVFPNMMIFKVENSKTNYEYDLTDIEDIEKISPISLFSEFYKMQNNGVLPNEKQLKIIEAIIRGEE